MNKYLLLIISIFLSFHLFSQNTNTGFYQNNGQIVNQEGQPNINVLYLLNTPELNIQLKKTGFSYDVYTYKLIEELYQAEFENVESEGVLTGFKFEQKFHRVDFNFLNSNPNVDILPIEQLPDYDNYYNLEHSAEGLTFVYRYKKILYKNLYNNIDVEFFIPEDRQQPIEYNFISK